MQGNKVAQQEKFCQDLINHKKFYRFCTQCAPSGKQSIIYCAKCYLTTKHREHSDHRTALISLQSQSFKKMMNSFLPQLHFNYNRLDDVSSFSYLQILLQNNIDKLMRHIANDRQFRIFFINCEFWKFTDAPDIDLLIQKIRGSIKACLGQSQSKIFEVDDLDNQFRVTIDWGLRKEIGDIEQKLKQADRQLSILQQQRYNLQIFITLYSASNKQQINSVLEFIQGQLVDNPQKWVLYLAKLNLLDISSQNKDQWKPILVKLCELNPNFKNSALYLLLIAFQYLGKLTNLEIANKKSKDKNFFYLVHPFTQQKYEIKNPQQFVNTISQAIILKNCPQNGLYYGYRGLGYLAQNKDNQALQDFQRAIKISNNLGSVVSNNLFCKIKQNKGISNQQFIKNIEKTKSKVLLMNAIKYFKSKKSYEMMLNCCDKLYQIQPSNQKIKLTLIQALIKNDKVYQAKSQLKSLIGQSSNTNNLKRLQRKAQYRQGKIQYQNKSEISTSIYSQLVKDKKTASSCFNYAASLFNNQNYTEAQKWINKAIDIKKKPKYLSLKFNILLMRRQFAQALSFSSNLNPAQLSANMLQFLQEQNV